MNMTQERKKNKILKNLLFIFLGIVITIGLLFLLKIFMPYGWYIENNTGACYTKCENKVTITDKGISESVEKVYDSVVLVENYKNNKLYSTGTGFVYKVDNNYGYLLTNYHVVEGNNTLKVVLSNDEIVDATLLGTDSVLDVAVIAIPKNKVIKVAEIGNSLESKLGDTVFTIGTPVDYEYRGTVTRGILSGKERLVSVKINNQEIVRKVLQTDSAINPGNSGGPLVSVNGKVIGINSLKLVEDEIEGMGFAIPIEDVMTYITELENKETIKRPYLGIKMINISEKSLLARLGYNISSNITKGILIYDIVDNSSVDNILKNGDIIVKINDKEVKNTAYFRYELYKYNIGEKIKVTYIRDGNTKTEEVTLKGQ